MSPDFSMQLDFAQSKKLSQHATPGLTSALTLPQSSLLLSLLASFSLSFKAAGRSEILRAANYAEMAVVEQMEKIVPPIRREIVLCQHVCELVFGVDKFDLNL